MATDAPAPTPAADPAPAPPAGPRHRPARPHRWRRIALRVVAGLVVLVLVLVGAVYLVLQHYFDKVPKVTLPPPPKNALASAGENFLLVGSDTRNGVGKGFGNPTDIAGQRSDTVILAHLPQGSARPTLVSFPRDSYVDIPAYTDPHGNQHPAHYDRLNAAFTLGGYSLLVRTIEQLSGVHVDHYVEVNFAGFQKMVDAIGGVTLCARTTRHDPANGPMGGSNDFMTAGVHKNVSGKVALAFVRDRHSFANQDISRIHDQQYFIAQLIKKIDSLGTLLRPWRVIHLMQSVSDSMRIDNKLTLNGIRTLVERLRHLDPAHVRFVTLPFATSNATETINGVPASVVLLDKHKDAKLFHQLRTDPTPSPSPHHSGSGKHHAPGKPGNSLSCGA